MKPDAATQLGLGVGEPTGPSARTVTLRRDRFVAILEEIETLDTIGPVREKLVQVEELLVYPSADREHLIATHTGADVVTFRRDVLASELRQIRESHSLERAKYYLHRLKQGIQTVKTSGTNDINLLRWKEYDDILTDSLWVFDRRDTTGAHLGWYWGNFIPQIPHQMLLRYTKKADWVMDPFVGSGTTLIECRRLGRNGIGIELSSEIAEKAAQSVDQEPNPEGVATEIAVGDSRQLDVRALLDGQGVSTVQLVIMHPPYQDIVRFSEDERDLSNARTTEDFLTMFGQAVDNVSPYLDKGRYCILVIGDAYCRGEWVPLGFYCMNEVLKRGYMLKGTVVKNFEGTRGKRSQRELWRYRALAGGFYIFKHEYIMVFKKVK